MSSPTPASATRLATDQSFQTEILTDPGLSVIDLWAEWCGPCRILGPTIDAVAEQYRGRAKVYKLNVDENPDKPASYHVRGIPTVLFVKGGKVVDQVVGAVPRSVLEATLQKHL